MIQYLLHQTDIRLGSWFNLWGCLFRVLLSFAETAKKEPFSSSVILALFETAKREKWISPRDLNADGTIDDNEKKDLWVERPNEIIQYAWGSAFAPGEAPRQIGIMDPQTGKLTWGTKGGARFTVLKWQTKNYFHFTRGDRLGREDWDPYPGIKKLKLIRVDFYR